MVMPFGMRTRIMKWPGVWRRKNTPVHLSPLFVAVGDGLPSFAGVSRNIVEDVESVLLLLVFLDLIHDLPSGGEVQVLLLCARGRGVIKQIPIDDSGCGQSVAHREKTGAVRGSEHDMRAEPRISGPVRFGTQLGSARSRHARRRHWRFNSLTHHGRAANGGTQSCNRERALE